MSEVSGYAYNRSNNNGTFVQNSGDFTSRPKSFQGATPNSARTRPVTSVLQASGLGEDRSSVTGSSVTLVASPPGVNSSSNRPVPERSMVNVVFLCAHIFWVKIEIKPTNHKFLMSFRLPNALAYSTHRTTTELHRCYTE